MDIQKQAYLFNTFSELFKERKLPPSSSCMCFGIECGDGWYGIIEHLCRRLMSTAMAHGYSPPSFSQIKEKYGTLRVHYNYPIIPDISNIDDYFKEIDVLITDAEDASSFVCERCGTTENVFTDQSGWIATLCKACRRIK